jgi:2-dehydropantoate 2-reductase
LKVLVYGAGAVGSYLGGMLATKNDVTMVGRRDHVSAIAERGLRITGLTEVTIHPKALEQVREEDRYDLVLLTVKSYDLEVSLAGLGPLLGDRTMLMVVQNGMRVLDLPARVGGSPLLLGVASFGVTHQGPGHIIHAGSGGLRLGTIEGGLDLDPYAHLFSESGIVCDVSSDIAKDVWRKAVINSAINPITALVRRRNGAILESKGLLGLSRSVFEESLDIAIAEGGLERGDVCFDDVLQVIRATAWNRSSMLQDVERGKRTEVDAINGSLIRAGERSKLPVDYNNTLNALINGIGVKDGG